MLTMSSSGLVGHNSFVGTTTLGDDGEIDGRQVVHPIVMVHAVGAALVVTNQA